MCRLCTCPFVPAFVFFISNQENSDIILRNFNFNSLNRLPMKASLLFTAAVAAAGIFAGCAKVEKVDWTIATDTVFRPFEFKNEQGEFVGIDVDILAAIAKDQGFTYTLNSIGWDAAIAACQAGQADGMIAGATINDERKASGWIFSDGYFDATQSFAVNADSDIKSLADLKGKNVAVKNGTAGAKHAESLKDKYGFTVTVFEDSPTMYQEVIGGNSAACSEDTPIMADNIKSGKVKMRILEDSTSAPAPYGFAVFNSAKQPLVDAFNAGLKNIKASGEYQKILDKYLK